MGGVYSTHDRNEKFSKNLVGKLEGEKPLGRPTCRWEDHIRVNLREIGWQSVDRIHVAQESDHGNELWGFHERQGTSELAM
jgi:hypothetical protein